MKNPLTQAGIERATSRFVAQHLIHCAAAVPSLSMVNTFIIQDNLCEIWYRFSEYNIGKHEISKKLKAQYSHGIEFGFQ